MSEDIPKQIFTILLVDDKPRTLLAQKKHITGYLKSKNFELNWIEDAGEKKGKGVFETLRSTHVDIILLDNNISGEITGLQILEKVRELHDLTDILFYSASQEHEETFQQASNFRFTIVIQGRDIEDPLEDLIDKNLMKWDDIIFLRGMVLSKVVELELKLNELFATYFSIAVPHMEDFHHLIMESGQGSLETKKRAIMQILEITGLSKKFEGFSNLGDLQTQRNLLAHGKLKKNEKNVLTVKFLGKEHQFRKGDIDKMLAKVQKLSELTDNVIETIRLSRKRAV